MKIREKKFKRFFDRFGHFVVTKAYGGGSFEIKLDSSAMQCGPEDIALLRAALTASFTGCGILNAEQIASCSYKNSKNFSAKRIWTHSQLLWNGGQGDLHTGSTLLDGLAMDKWRNSLTKEPAMLTTEMRLEPISTLVGIHDSSKRECTYDALVELLEGKFKVVENKQKEERE